MKALMCSWTLAALAMCALQSGCTTQEPPQQPTAVLTDEIRKELIDARAAAWSAFFQKDVAPLEAMLAPELVAIQQSSDRWEDRTHLLNLARSMNEQGVKMLRLEFPRTEIQLFGDTAILYYTYIFETGLGERSAVDAGRGTEIFVRRDGKWVDVGWHLDHGAFVRKNGQWIRQGDPVPEPSTVPPAQPPA